MRCLSVTLGKKSSVIIHMLEEQANDHMHRANNDWAQGCRAGPTAGEEGLILGVELRPVSAPHLLTDPPGAAVAQKDGEG